MSKHKAMHDGNEDYGDELYDLQVELVKLQRALIDDGTKLLVILEGRDGAGKDGTIKRLVEHMSPRETRVFAPGIPSRREEHEWYFQRFVPELPAAGEFVVFNRSWYNRAGVEIVMGFCTKTELKCFFDTLPDFESVLVKSGFVLRKYYLDISRGEQKRRLAARKADPLKQWKISPVDEAALAKWSAYSKARDEMFRRTHHAKAPWNIVRADHKKEARLGFIRDLLASFEYKGKNKKLLAPQLDKKGPIVFEWSENSGKKYLTP